LIERSERGVFASISFPVFLQPGPPGQVLLPSKCVPAVWPQTIEVDMMTNRPQQDLLREEAERLISARDADPYNRSVRENLAEVLFKLLDQHPVGTVPRSRHLLQLIAGTFPTPTMVAAYFENLERLLERERRQFFPGQVILGLGSGRCGSTSLSAMLAAVTGSCATHENPPLIAWNPESEQLDFHMRRFRLLTRYFPLVFDSAHWWLRAIDRFFADFPDGKAIGLYRDNKACAQSFARVKGEGLGSSNHWIAPGNGIWSANNWDPTYPTFSLPEDADLDPDAARAQLILRYVEEYNDALFALRERLPDKVMLVRTEELALPAIHEEIFEFIGFRAELPPLVFNAGTTDDGALSLQL
jgi:hypothetical protein